MTTEINLLCNSSHHLLSCRTETTKPISNSKHTTVTDNDKQNVMKEGTNKVTKKQQNYKTKSPGRVCGRLFVYMYNSFRERVSRYWGTCQQSWMSHSKRGVSVFCLSLFAGLVYG